MKIYTRALSLTEREEDNFKTTPSFLGKGGTYSSIHYQL